jgi:hypothetical protein
VTYQSVPTLLVSFSLVDEDTTAIKSEQHFEHVSFAISVCAWESHDF